MLFTAWIKASLSQDSYFCLFFVCFGSLSNGFRLRDDNNAMEIGVDRELSRATGEAMNFQGNTVHLDNVSNSEELDLILLLVLMTVKPNGMNLNGLSSTHILWETSAVKQGW